MHTVEEGKGIVTSGRIDRHVIDRTLFYQSSSLLHITAGISIPMNTKPI